MNEIIFLVEDDVAGGYCARALDYAIFTEADTLDDLKANIKDAINCHFDDIEFAPKIIRLHFVHEEVMTYAEIA